MAEMIYPWQQHAWEQLQILRDTLPHAILFYGDKGTGKSLLVETFAQSLLCESLTIDQYPCGTCPSCIWFMQYGHPDYRRIIPEILAGVSASTEDKDADDTKTTKAASALSKEIKIDQIRELSELMNVSTHRKGRRVVVLYPAEALNSIAANALLKTLEEPPPDTVFLLISHARDRVLPTILSRCRQFALDMPTRGQSLDWLKTKNVRDAQLYLDQEGGAPLSALALHDCGHQTEMADFLALLAKPSIDIMLKIVDRVQKIPLSQLVLWFSRWVHDLILLKLVGTVRYYPKYHSAFLQISNTMGISEMLALQKRVNQRTMIVGHPVSAKLFLEEMLLDYCASCAGVKQ